MAKKRIGTYADFVDCSQLTVGQEVKNYGALCELLGEKTLAGNSKAAQLKRWERYFSYEKQGQKFVIKELHELPLSHVDGRKLKVGIYVNYIECLLMDYLAKQNGNPIFLSKLDWCLRLGMMNNRFPEYMPHQDRELDNGVLEVAQNDKERFSPLEEIIAKKYHLPLGSDDISIFYDMSLGKLYEILNNALKSMMNRRLIRSSKVFIIFYEDDSHRVVDDSEILAKEILRMQKKTLSSMGYEKINQVYSSHQIHRYYKEFQKMISKRNATLEEDAPKWARVAERTRIIYLRKEIREQLPTSAQQLFEMAANETDECRRELNGKIADSISALANRKKNEFNEQHSGEQFNEELPNKGNHWAMKRHNRSFMMNTLAKENFREIQASLIDYLIRI